MAMAAVTVTDQSFPQEVLASPVPVLVDFWAQWCGPCMALGPFVEQLSGRYAGMAKVAKIDIDQNPGVTQQYGIRSIPALLVFKGGVVVEQFVGNPGSDAALDQLLRRHL